ncbi:hypothetical protein LH704_18090 [Burkholderia cenocepacia]|uniref:hypothetical protein n=1 Tax=Burkholderia cenocepacia TaxID=95486 RepID=UPI001F2CA6C5|nr:hypothetical protein [Burkholderia cenocepacia]MCF1369859.1 hypothetical protein [Burkholderia cenocepacia]MCF1386110.1 hypothetical protein [Burkholderia cenocepacia]
MYVPGFYREFFKLITVILIAVYSNSSFAWKVWNATGCTWTPLSDAIMLDFTVSVGNTSAHEDIDGSKALVIYRYTKRGNLAAVDGETTTAVEKSGPYPGENHFRDYRTIFYTGPNGSNFWKISDLNQVIDYRVVVNRKEIKDWPAIGVQIGRIYFKDNYPLSTREVVYITEENIGGVGSCTLFKDQTVKPPPPPISLNVNAPDWNLGELYQGENIKKFSSVKEQLCFTYTGTAVSEKSFIINASNVNGIASNTYRLRNLNDSSQLVPYSVTLDSGSSTVSLPNMSNAALSLDSSGKTCFVPTFKASVGSSVKEGNYSDVLTFTVVTKS